MREYTEIETITQLLGLVTEPGHIDHHVFQNIDFSDLADLASQSTYSDCLFLGCVLPESFSQQLDKTNLIFPKAVICTRPIHFTPDLIPAMRVP